MSFQGSSNSNCENQSPFSRLGQQFFLNEADTRGVSQPPRPDALQFVREFLDESYGQNFQTFRSDDLFEEVRSMEGNMGNQQGQPPGAVVRRHAVPVAASVLGSPHSHCVHWIPHPSPAFPLDHYFRQNPVSHTIYPSYPTLPPPVSVEASSPRTRIVNSLPFSPDFKPVQCTLEDLKGPWDLPASVGANKELSKEGASASSKDKIDKKKNDEKDGAHSTPQTSKYNLGDPSSEDGAREANPSLEILDKSSLLELESILDETEAVDLDLALWKFICLQASKKKSPTQPHGKRDAPTMAAEQKKTLEFIEKIEKDISKFSALAHTVGAQHPSTAVGEGKDKKPLSIFDEYSFEQRNPMQELKDPFNEGIANLCTGNVKASALCLEAAIIRILPASLVENAVAWLALGISQAANEQDVLAIIALKEFLKYEPDNLNALIYLTVSYLHEGYRNLAIITIWDWLSQNPSYSKLVDISPPEDMYDVSSPINMDFHKKLENLLIRAANKIPFGTIDADVQYVLGLLYSAVDDHIKSADCFEAAASAESCDEIIWNSLGEAQLNNERYPESFTAFQTALNVRPGYVRALYNLGLTFSRVGNQDEAMKNFLKALTLQAESSRGLTGRLTESIWSSIETTVRLLGRVDLEEAVEKRDLVLLTKAFGIE